MQHFYWADLGGQARKCTFVELLLIIPCHFSSSMPTVIALPVFNHEKLRTSSNIFRALAHPLRMRMVGVIWSKEAICVNEIFETLGIEQSLASQHLRILRQANLVTTHREGKFVYYAMDRTKMLTVRRALLHLGPSVA